MIKKEIFLGSLFLLLIASFSSYFFYKENKVNKKEVSVMQEQDNKVFSYIKDTPYYKEEYENFYHQIEYQKQEYFLEEVNAFLDLKYSPEEINHLYQFVKEENRKKLLESEKIDVQHYYTIHNFEVDKIPRYEKYQQIHNCSLEEAVLKVNIGLDHDFYTQIEQVQNSNDYTVLINKFHSLGNYAPSDLKKLSYDGKYQLREKAADAFEKLVSFAKLENVYIRPYSAYRSFEYQKELYNRYVNRDGKEKVDTYSARAGHSEHQTGLAVDVWSEGYTELLENDANWLKENAHQYGFIVRYTKEKESITGYIEEPWHLRYIGIDLAIKVHDLGITYDEYYDLYIK